MKEPFVPLNQAAVSGRNRAEFRVAIVDQPENLQPFQPLGHPSGKPGGGGQCESRITLQRDGERVSGIRIQCTCGQLIELQCVYQ